MNIVKLTKDDVNPIELMIDGDIKLILDLESEIKMDAEYDNSKYTEEYIQNIGTEFLKGLLDKTDEYIANEDKN